MHDARFCGTFLKDDDWEHPAMVGTLLASGSSNIRPAPELGACERC